MPTYSDEIWREVHRLYVEEKKSPQQIEKLPGMPAWRTIHRHAKDGKWDEERDNYDLAMSDDIGVLKSYRGRLLAKLNAISDSLIGTNEDPTNSILLNIQRIDNRIADAEHEINYERAVRVGGRKICEYLRDPRGGNDSDLATEVAEAVEPAANWARSKQS